MVPLAQAEAFFTQQLTAKPQSPFACLLRGVARYENDDLDRAVADLDQALRLDPKYVPALIERAYLWQWRNRLDQAVADVSKAIELDPRNSYALVERGVFEYNLKEYENALRDFQAALDLGSQAAVNGEQAVVSAIRACELTEWKEPHILATLAAACARGR